MMRLIVIFCALFGVLFAWAACSVGELCLEGAVGCSLDPCDNRLLDEGEADIDCGSSCAPCAAGATCTEAEDCASARCFGGQCCTPPCPIWTRAMGGPAMDYATSAVVLEDGGIVLAGHFSGVIDLGGGPRTTAAATAMFVAAYGPDGAYRFDRIFDGAATVFTPILGRGAGDHLWVGGHYTGATFAIDGAVFQGSGYNDGFILELDGQGAVLQKHPLRSHGGGFDLRRIVPTGDGGFILFAQMGSSLDFGDGTVEMGSGIHAVLARFDANGTRMWSRALGGSGDDYALGMAVWGDSIFVGINYRGLDCSLGGPLLPPVDDGGMFAMALAEFDLDGVHRWSHGYESRTWLWDLAADDDGLYVAGLIRGRADLGSGALTPNGTIDLLVGRFDASDGTPLWVVHAGDSESDAAAIVPAGDGGVIVAGRFTGSVELDALAVRDGVDSLFVARLGPDGAGQWVGSGGGIFLGAPIGLVLAAADDVRVFGAFAGTLEMGEDDAHKSAGRYDGFVSAFLP